MTEDERLLVKDLPDMQKKAAQLNQHKVTMRALQEISVTRNIEPTVEME